MLRIPSIRHAPTMCIYCKGTGRSRSSLRTCIGCKGRGTLSRCATHRGDVLIAKDRVAVVAGESAYRAKEWTNSGAAKPGKRSRYGNATASTLSPITTFHDSLVIL